MVTICLSIFRLSKLFSLVNHNKCLSCVNHCIRSFRDTSETVLLYSFSFPAQYPSVHNCTCRYHNAYLWVRYSRLCTLLYRYAGRFFPAVHRMIHSCIHMQAHAWSHRHAHIQARICVRRNAHNFFHNFCHKPFHTLSDSCIGPSDTCGLCRSIPTVQE